MEDMRRRLTKTAWFGPKLGFGWGWRPQNWQGWAATAVFVALLIASAVIWSGTAFAIAVVVLVAALLVTAALTGDPPG